MSIAETSMARDGWQEDLLASFTSVDDLAKAGLISQQATERLRAVESEFRVRIPRYYASLFDADLSVSCPIRMQALPSLGEADPELPAWAQALSQEAYGRSDPWTADSIGDLAKLAAPRLTHRYGNRAILHTTSLCALYCRFCFRKSHLNDRERPLYEGTLEPSLNYLAEHSEIQEVILTGGDPLSMTDSWLESLLSRLEKIGHIEHVRIHSRMAVTLPSRLTEKLAAVLADRRFVVSLVSHFNHPRELTAICRERLTTLRRRGVPLYNQTVLLAGINDDAVILSELFQRLYTTGVRPFYLHHPDWTPGTFQFRLPLERGKQLMTELRGRISGPAIPQYVLDLPGGAGKVDLMNTAISALKRQDDAASGLAGALYKVDPPHTRQASKDTLLYFDLWKRRDEH